jgi:putative glutamine amidotransferase
MPQPVGYAAYMVAPLIGITTSITVDKIPERAYVNGTYIRAVQAAGGIPVLLTPHFTPEVQAALWQRVDGLVLTGGGDIEPRRFGETPHATVDEVSPARDELELGLTRRAVDDDVPLFAICRGIQVLNVALGGSLVQDIPSEWPQALPHSQKAPRHEPTHAVKVMGEGTRLGRVLGALEIEVNSMHHQAIKRLGAGLREVAWAPDGIIEGVEMSGEERFVLGVQWHPEELVGHDQAARNLFAAVVDAARQRARR